MKTPFLTVAEVAELEGVSTRRIRSLCDMGRMLYATKAGKSWLISRNYAISPRPNGRPKKIKSRFQSPSSKK